MDSEIVQGLKCKSCKRDILISDCTIIRWTAGEGNVRISTCVDCIANQNGLVRPTVK